MISKIKNLIIALLSLSAIMFVATPATASAVDCANPQTTQEQLQCGSCNASGVADSNCSDAAKKSTDTINSTITNVINLVSIVAGIIAVLMLILGGVRYVTSSGNEQSVAGAKKTIIYAIIGLIIVALAQIIVKFVLTKATKP